MKKTNIVLIGFAGCGKSTAGKLLAKRLNYSFIDTDSEIEKQEGMTIPEIFETYGETYFRRLESEAAKEAASEKNIVISCGGGLIKNPYNISVLKESGYILYLESSPEKIYSNVRYNNSRPLLEAPDKLGRIKELMAQRLPLYEEYAEITVNCTDLTIDKTVSEIEGILKKVMAKQ